MLDQLMGKDSLEQLPGNAVLKRVSEAAVNEVMKLGQRPVTACQHPPYWSLIAQMFHMWHLNTRIPSHRLHEAVSHGASQLVISGILYTVCEAKLYNSNRLMAMALVVSKHHDCSVVTCIDDVQRHLTMAALDQSMPTAWTAMYVCCGLSST